MKKLVPLFALALALSSCASTDVFDKHLKTWVGANEDSIVKGWGPPKSVYPLTTGGKILTWDRGGPAYVGGTLDPNGTFTSTGCKVDMTVSPDHIVEGYRFEGGSCKAESDWRAAERRKQLERQRQDYGQGLD